MLHYVLSTSDSCDCCPEQMATRCPIYHLPEEIDGLLDLDDETRVWLENNALDIWVVSDVTREKNNNK